MSWVINVSDDLGKLLLDGWTLSDRTCAVEGCRAVPLIRSPPGQDPVWFCPSCGTNGASNVVDPGPGHSESQQPSSPGLTSSTHYSKSSTPPTEDLPSSPTFDMPAETEDSIRRRQQSDAASTEIGRRLLRGWAMLGDECPNSTCYGIPLVRPPKVGQEKDPKKECVICGMVYVAQGLDSLVPFTSSGSGQEEMPSSSAPPVRSNVTLKGKEIAHQNHNSVVDHSASDSIGTSSVAPAVLALSKESKPALSSAQPTTTSSEDILSSLCKALHATLSALCQRLLLLSGQPVLDPVTISQTADAIAKTGQALEVISSLRRRQD